MITQFDFQNKVWRRVACWLTRSGKFGNVLDGVACAVFVVLWHYFVSSGNGKFCIDNFEQDIRPGTVFFSSTGQIRKWVVPEVPKGIVLIFEAEFLCSFFKDAKFVENLSFFHSGNPPVLQLTSGDYHQLRTLFQDIQQEIISFRPNDRHLLRALLYQVLILLDRKFVAEYHESNNKKPVNKYVDGFAQLVESNHHQRRSVEYYAERLPLRDATKWSLTHAQGSSIFTIIPANSRWE